MVLLIYGLPGVGKTTIVKRLLGVGNKVIEKPFAHYVTPNGIVFGTYEEHHDTPFLGTDKLSMSVQPLALDFILKNKDLNYIIEGARLFNESFIVDLTKGGVDVKVLFIDAPKTHVTERRKTRGEEQDGQFLKACETKINNIKDKFDYHQIHNINLEHIDDCVENIKKILDGSNDFLVVKAQQNLFD